MQCANFHNLVCENLNCKKCWTCMALPMCFCPKKEVQEIRDSLRRRTKEKEYDDVIVKYVKRWPLEQQRYLDYAQQEKLIMGQIKAYTKEVLEGKSVLDIGCGMGVFLEICSSLKTVAIGVDHPESDFRPIHINRGLPVIYHDCRKTPWPFSSLSFDIVRCVATITFLQPENFSSVLKEMIRIARQKILIIANKGALWESSKHLLHPVDGWELTDRGEVMIWRRNDSQ